MHIDEKTYEKILDYIATKITEDLHKYGDMSSKCIFIKDNDKHFFTCLITSKDKNTNFDIDTLKRGRTYGSTASEYFNIMHNAAMMTHMRDYFGVKRLFSKTIDEYLIAIDMQLNDNVE